METKQLHLWLFNIKSFYLLPHSVYHIIFRICLSPLYWTPNLFFTPPTDCGTSFCTVVIVLCNVRSMYMTKTTEPISNPKNIIKTRYLLPLSNQVRYLPLRRISINSMNRVYFNFKYICITMRYIKLTNIMIKYDIGSPFIFKVTPRINITDATMTTTSGKIMAPILKGTFSTITLSKVNLKI